MDNHTAGSFNKSHGDIYERQGEKQLKALRVVNIRASVANLVSTNREAHVDHPDPRFIRELIALRAAREGFFAADLFAEPAWDILLDLTAAKLEGKTVSVSSLCIAARVPTTTALRHIKAMVHDGTLERDPDQRDARRAYIRISSAAYEQMRLILHKFHSVLKEPNP